MQTKRRPAGTREMAKRADLEAIAFHVVPNGQRWEIERNDTFTGSFAYDVDVAVGLAIADAQRDRHNGLTASVCVQQPNGSCRHVWP